MQNVVASSSRVYCMYKTFLLVHLAKVQYTRDDEAATFCINQDKNIVNELYIVFLISFQTMSSITMHLFAN